MNSKKSNNQKSKATLTKTKNGRKLSCQKLTKSKQLNCRAKILPEHQPFVFECFAKGMSGQKIADEVKENYKIDISKQGLHDYRLRHRGDYEEFLTRIKEVRSANAKCRLLELEEIKDKLKEKIIEILGYVPRQWEELNLSSLLSQFVNIMDQIRIDCGDKAKDKNGEKRDQTVIQIINTIPGMFADGDNGDTGKKNTNAGRGFRLDRV